MSFPTLKTLLEDEAAQMKEAELHFIDFIENILAHDVLRRSLENTLNSAEGAIESDDNTITLSTKIKGKSIEAIFDLEATTAAERDLCAELGNKGYNVKVIDGYTPIASKTIMNVPVGFLMELALDDMTDEPLQKTWQSFLDHAYTVKQRVTGVLADSKYYKSYNDPTHPDYEDPNEAY